MALGRQKPEGAPSEQADAAQEQSFTTQDQIQAEQQAQAPDNQEQILSRDQNEVDVNPDAAEQDVPDRGYHKGNDVAIQAQEETVVFIPSEDFEGRINQTDYTFQKDVRVRVTRDEANTWVDAKKGIIL